MVTHTSERSIVTSKLQSLQQQHREQQRARQLHVKVNPKAATAEAIDSADSNLNAMNMKHHKGSYTIQSETKSKVIIPTTMTLIVSSTMSTTASKHCNPTALRIPKNRSPSKICTLQRFPGFTHFNGALMNGFSGNSTPLMRAVSSPSLTDVLQEQNELPKIDAQQRSCTLSHKIQDKLLLTGNSGSSNNSSSSGSGIGVLQKFKRTLTNFNSGSSGSSISNSSTNLNKQSGETTQYLSPHNARHQPQHLTLGKQDVVDGSASSAAGKHRFGPLIWRSSKERRKTKFNRRDKCNSGDSGIQIELENDDQLARIFATTTATTAGTALNKTTNMKAESQQNTELPKLAASSVTIRRTNSAKAGDNGNVNSTDELVTATANVSATTANAMNAKAKIFRKMEGNNELRVVPESLPARSVSQPSGLETYGRSDLVDDSDDSDSVTSHDGDAPTYYPVYAEVLYSFNAAGPQELSLERGTLIEVLRKEIGPWWFGRIKKEDASLVEEILDPELGWFPKEFVRVINYPEADVFFLSYMRHQLHQHQQPEIGKDQQQQQQHSILKEDNITIDSNQASNVTTIIIESPPPPLLPPPSAALTVTSSASNLCLTNNPSVEPTTTPALVPSSRINVIMNNAELLRRSAIRELLDTEVNYVKLLQSICEGYLPAMSKRIDIFSPNSIRLIFSNIAAIYKFQRKFLDALRKGIEQNQIAKVFLKMHKGFLCYSTYCNAYPRALIELESYDRVKDAKIILDNCRESENLAELPLSGHLLAPVQRICRYPLHLGELVKTAMVATSEAQDQHKIDLQQLEEQELSQINMPDTRESVEKALEAMKSITEAVNEGKRHSETIARHQASFQNFKGTPLHVHSTRFFLQIDATRQKQNLWNTSYTLFVFDNQLIYCKRDILKRSQYIYKGRIFLDRCRIVNVRDGKMFGHNIKNSLRIYCEARDKWYDFSFRSANRKHRFLNTLALERQFGGKAWYISEMTGLEYAYEESPAAVMTVGNNAATVGTNGSGDYSDQSDYEQPESEHVPPIRIREFLCDTTTGTSASGESSVPESPTKSAITAKNYCETLPKKSHSRSDISMQQHSDGAAASSSCNNIDYQTSSLGRRRLGNWFRKPKSTTCTPQHSPKHKAPLGVLSDMSNNDTQSANTASSHCQLSALTVKSVKSD